jgi:phage tail sheath protein FI
MLAGGMFMPEYQAPGVYIEEFQMGPRPIEGVSTSTAGFLGEAERGPLEPQLVISIEQFVRLYGRLLPTDRSNLPFAVDGFIRNGGRRC